LKEKLKTLLGESAYNVYEKKCNIIDKVEIEEEILFKDKNDTCDLRINELTTGEKIILITILWEDQVKTLTANEKLILMLDKPDCFLHPYAIEKFIVKLKVLTHRDSNVQVIFTSHNPGTISLLDDEDIFYLDEESLNKKELVCCQNKNNSIE
jgi:predicted ATP-dependent endonuclease of OLD family